LQVHRNGDSGSPCCARSPSRAPRARSRRDRSPAPSPPPTAGASAVQRVPKHFVLLPDGLERRHNDVPWTLELTWTRTFSTPPENEPGGSKATAPEPRPR
jgi:hypothetical protein